MLDDVRGQGQPYSYKAIQSPHFLIGCAIIASYDSQVHPNTFKDLSLNGSRPANKPFSPMTQLICSGWLSDFSNGNWPRNGFGLGIHQVLNERGSIARTNSTGLQRHWVTHTLATSSHHVFLIAIEVEQKSYATNLRVGWNLVIYSNHFQEFWIVLVCFI